MEVICQAAMADRSGMASSTGSLRVGNRTKPYVFFRTKVCLGVDVGDRVSAKGAAHARFRSLSALRGAVFLRCWLRCAIAICDRGLLLPCS